MHSSRTAGRPSPAGAVPVQSNPAKHASVATRPAPDSGAALAPAPAAAGKHLGPRPHLRARTAQPGAAPRWWLAGAPGNSGSTAMTSAVARATAGAFGADEYVQHHALKDGSGEWASWLLLVSADDQARLAHTHGLTPADVTSLDVATKQAAAAAHARYLPPSLAFGRSACGPPHASRLVRAARPA